MTCTIEARLHAAAPLMQNGITLLAQTKEIEIWMATIGGLRCETHVLL